MLHLLDRHDLYGQMALPKWHEPEQEVPELYRLAAESGGLFANVAFDEPFGLILLEAAASGLPVVATNQGGPTEILCKLGNGELVDPTDMMAIQHSMLRIPKDTQPWQTFADNGLSHLAENYGWEGHVAQYIETVRPLITPGGKVTVVPFVKRRRRPRLAYGDSRHDPDQTKPPFHPSPQ